jgi:hypothetical protein
LTSRAMDEVGTSGDTNTNTNPSPSPSPSPMPIPSPSPSPDTILSPVHCPIPSLSLSLISIWFGSSSLTRRLVPLFDDMSAVRVYVC